MATKITLQHDLNVIAKLDKTEGFASGIMPVQFKKLMTFTAGTGIGQIDLAHHVRMTLDASGSKSITLDGTLTNILGAHADFVKVKYIGVINSSDEATAATDADILILGNFMTTNFGVSFSMGLNAPGLFEWIDGVGKTVVASTGNVFTITNNDGADAAQVDVLIAGTSS